MEGMVCLKSSGVLSFMLDDLRDYGRHRPPLRSLEYRSVRVRDYQLLHVETKQYKAYTPEGSKSEGCTFRVKMLLEYLSSTNLKINYSR